MQICKPDQNLSEDVLADFFSDLLLVLQDYIGHRTNVHQLHVDPELAIVIVSVKALNNVVLLLTETHYTSLVLDFVVLFLITWRHHLQRKRHLIALALSFVDLTRGTRGYSL